MSTLLILLANVLSIITNADICISRDPEGTSNVRFLGNYQEKTDSNGGTYYEKDQAFCDTEPEYLYLNNDQWRVSTVLNGDDAYIRCPTANLATPDLCPAGTWNNGGMSPDPQLQVTNTACPDSTPTLECEYILLQDTGNAGGNSRDGLYSKIPNEVNLYEQDGYYLQYSKLLKAWIVKNSDVRESCDNPRYNFYSTDTKIDNLNVGDENVQFDMSFPLQDGDDYSCKQPKISCLNSQPSDEILNDALCNYPCNIEIPSLSCNYIQIDRSEGNYWYDGIYNKVDDNLYRYKYDDDNIYFFQYYKQGEYYMISSTDYSNVCGNTAISYSLRSDDSRISALEHGNSIVPELDYPVDAEFTITCLESTASPTVGPTASPVPAAPDGLCVAAATGRTFNGGIPLTDLAGTYVLMDEDINGSPAYELAGCAGKSAYVSIDPVYPYYFLSLDKDNPFGSNTWVMYCSNTASINNDISQCTWSNNGQFFEVTAGGGCQCGKTLGSNVNALPMIETGDIVRELPKEVVGMPSTDTKPISIWSQFVDVLHEETISIALVCVLVMMMVWTIVMCADLFGCKRSNKNYSAVKVVDDI